MPGDSALVGSPDRSLPLVDLPLLLLLLLLLPPLETPRSSSRQRRDRRTRTVSRDVVGEPGDRRAGVY